MRPGAGTSRRRRSFWETESGARTAGSATRRASSRLGREASPPRPRAGPAHQPPAPRHRRRAVVEMTLALDTSGYALFDAGLATYQAGRAVTTKPLRRNSRWIVSGRPAAACCGWSRSRSDATRCRGSPRFGDRFGHQDAPRGVAPIDNVSASYVLPALEPRCFVCHPHRDERAAACRAWSRGPDTHLSNRLP